MLFVLESIIITYQTRNIMNHPFQWIKMLPMVCIHQHNLFQLHQKPTTGNQPDVTTHLLQLSICTVTTCMFPASCRLRRTCATLALAMIVQLKGVRVKIFYLNFIYFAHALQYVLICKMDHTQFTTLCSKCEHISRKNNICICDLINVNSLTI